MAPAADGMPRPFFLEFNQWPLMSKENVEATHGFESPTRRVGPSDLSPQFLAGIAAGRVQVEPCLMHHLLVCEGSGR